LITPAFISSAPFDAAYCYHAVAHYDVADDDYAARAMSAMPRLSRRFRCRQRAMPITLICCAAVIAAAFAALSAMLLL